MVLVIGDQIVKEVPFSTSGIYSTWPHLKESSNNLTNLRTEDIGPRGLLYLRQREYAVTGSQDENVHILGTDDATTSVMAVLRHTGVGTTGLAHFDKCSHEECLKGVHICSHEEGVVYLLTRINELSSPPLGFNTEGGRLELFVVGGFPDRRRICEKVTLSLLNAFHRCPCHIHLNLLCTGEMNATSRENIMFPLITGIGVSVQNGNIFPAKFSDRGPYLTLRSTRIFTGAQQMVDVYDSSQGLLRIGPFSYEPHAGVDLLLNQSDDVILQCLSTSPEVESPAWVKMVREVLKYVKDNPFPWMTIFPDNLPHFFQRDKFGNWSQVKLTNNNDTIPDANLQVGLHHTNTWSSPGTVTTTSAAPPPTPVAPQSTPWGNTVPSSYSALELNCHLKTTPHSMMNAPQYEDHLLNQAKNRYIHTWQTASQL
ncbi:UNVERIFIED_CONTAM: hypothetical protein RMT77_009727 [Armadillidium vulgare]